MNAIEVKSLTKYYKNFKAVDNISLSVKSGEIMGFIGQNGAGKSTTIRCLLNMIFPSSGELNILGYNCVRDSKEIKKYTSFVPSEVEYYANMRVKDLFDYSCSLYMITDKSRINDLCTYFELDLNKKIQELSLGNKKKVSLIQALIKNPKVIILDEPTSGLDPLSQEKLFNILLEEKKKGVAILLSSHNLSEVEKYCDRVAIIKKGKLLEVDSIDRFRSSNELVVKYSIDNIKNTIIWNKSINELLEKLTELKPTDLEITKKSVEDEFKKYYEDK